MLSHVVRQHVSLEASLCLRDCGKTGKQDIGKCSYYDKALAVSHTGLTARDLRKLSMVHISGIIEMHGCFFCVEAAGTTFSVTGAKRNQLEGLVSQRKNYHIIISCSKTGPSALRQLQRTNFPQLAELLLEHELAIIRTMMCHALQAAAGSTGCAGACERFPQDLSHHGRLEKHSTFSDSNMVVE